MQPQLGVANARVWRFPSQRKTFVALGVGVGFLLLTWWIKRLFSKTKKLPPPARQPPIPQTSDQLAIVDLSYRSDSSATFRTAVSRQSNRRRMAPSVSGSVPPSEAVLFGGLDACHDMMNALQKAMNGLEMVKNRSDRDKQRADLLTSVVDRLRILETDLSRIVQEGGFDHLRSDDGVSLKSGGLGVGTIARTTTLSVLSDDSFMSAVEDFGVSIDDIETGALVYNLPYDQLIFLQEGIRAARNGEVPYRKDRSDFCQCSSEEDFLAKLYCIRQALHVICSDEHRRVWLSNSGRQLLGHLMQNMQQDPTAFYKAYDEMILFLENDDNLDMAEAELKSRMVPELSFWDVVLDFILLDSFDDLKSPPSAIYSVTKNYWLSQSMKYSTISTIIWSMLKAKRQRLQYPNGFIAHFYNISEAVSPSITLGFLGTDQALGELCHSFKEQVIQLVIDLFNPKRVRYTTLEELVEDVWVVLQTRTESILTRLSSELLPA